MSHCYLFNHRVLPDLAFRFEILETWTVGKLFGR